MALSPAEKQKAYRDRQRRKLQEISNVTEIELQAQSIVDSLGIGSMDVDTKSYFVGRLIGELSDLKINYVIAGLFDSMSNVTKGD